MKTTVTVFLLLMGFLGKALGQTYWENSSSDPQFCFQNFNAYGPLYASGLEARTQGLLGHLKAIPKCEIVQLQEVWVESHIQHLESSLQNQYVFADPNRETRIGIMSMVMGDLLSEETHTFVVNNSGSLLDRARTVVNVDKAFHVLRTKLPVIDEEIYVMNTHLHPSSQAVRLTQILDILQWRLKNQDIKLLLSGDFNADPESLERKLIMGALGLHDAMSESFGDAGYPKDYCTYCRANPLSWLNSDHVFDYIFFSNAGGDETAFKVLSGAVNLKGSAKKPLSDHYGIRVQFSVQKVSVREDISPEQKKSTVAVLKEVLKIFAQEKSSDFGPYYQLTKTLIQDLELSASPMRSYLAQSLR